MSETESLRCVSNSPPNDTQAPETIICETQASRAALTWATMTREEKCDALKSYVGSKKSAADIARELGACRNAILGFAHRNKIACFNSRLTGIKLSNLRARTYTPALAPGEARSTKSSAMTRRMRIARLRDADEAINLTALGPAWTPLPGSTPVPLEHRAGCAWPIDVDGKTLFCNCARAPEAAYCPTHLRRLTQPRRT